VPELLQQEFSCCFRTIPLFHELFASPHHCAEEPEWLKYRPNSVRLTEREDKERRTFIRISTGPDISYVLSGTADTDLATRRIAFLGRYFHAASLSSNPQSKFQKLR
jgi:hypothetical protein